MGRLKTLEVGILNIKVHPHHHPHIYIDLMNEVFASEALIKIRGDDWGAPNFIRKVGNDPIDGMFGSFYRFLQIDPKKAWLDLKNKKPILDSKGDPIPQVDQDKKPNLREMEFVFYPKGHLMFFNAKAITPGSAQKLINSFCNLRKIKRKFGPVDVEVVSNQEVVEKILAIPALTYLKISISRPNGDVISGRKKKFLEDMEARGVRRYEEVSTSLRSEGVKANEDLKAKMELATTNGKVDAVGYSGSERIIESTVPHPQIERAQYDEEKETLLRAMANFSWQLLERVVNRG
jgi:hypothetical protein